MILRLGMAGRGRARQGMAGRGWAWPGYTHCASYGVRGSMAGPGQARQGRVRLAGARLGKAIPCGGGNPPHRL